MIGNWRSVPCGTLPLLRTAVDPCAATCRGLCRPCGNIMAGLHALGNGDALDEYCEELAAARREALARMAAGAAERGANAVIGVRFDTAAVGHDMSELVAYGTAVLVEQGA